MTDKEKVAMKEVSVIYQDPGFDLHQHFILIVTITVLVLTALSILSYNCSVILYRLLRKVTGVCSCLGPSHGNGASFLHQAKMEDV